MPRPDVENRWPEAEWIAALQPLDLLPHLHSLALVGYTLVIATTVIAIFPQSRWEGDRDRARRHWQRRSSGPSAAYSHRRSSVIPSSSSRGSNGRHTHDCAAECIRTEETPLYLAYVEGEEIALPSPSRPGHVEAFIRSVEEQNHRQITEEITGEIKKLTICKSPEDNKPLPPLPREHRNSVMQLEPFKRAINQNIKRLSDYYFRYVKQIRRASVNTLLQAAKRRVTSQSPDANRDLYNVEGNPIRRWVGSTEYIGDFEDMPSVENEKSTTTPVWAEKDQASTSYIEMEDWIATSINSELLTGLKGFILGGWETITSHAKKFKDLQQRDLVLLCTAANYDFNVPLTFIHAQGLFNSVQSRFLTNMTRRDVTEDNQELFARLADPARKGREMLDAHMRQRELDRMTASTRAETSSTRTTRPAMRPRSMSFEQPRSKRSCNLLREKPKRDVNAYTEPFLSLITDNPTVFHAVHHFSDRLRSKGFTELSERQSWYSALGLGGKYFVTRNGSSLIAFEIGNDYRAGNGAAIVASHVDAVTARLKPIPKVADKAGYVQLGVAPYAGGLNTTWFDRDLGIAGRVLVKSKDTGKIETRLVKLGWPIARIPTLAPHFGTAANVPYPNKETQMVPIIGLETQEGGEVSADPKPRVLGGAGTFTSTQPEKLVKAIAGELGIEDHSTIVNWELELFDSQPAQLGGLDKEFIFAGRIDDKLCAFAAVEGLIESTASSTYSFETSFEPHILDIPQDSDIFHSSLETSPQNSNKRSSILKITALFDDEEIGSLLRQGALSTLLPSTISRITESFFENNTPPPTIPPPPHGSNANLLGQTYANSFLISADVTHAVNPNFLSVYLENHSPRLNTGIAIQADPNGHTTTDAISTAFLQRIAEKCGSELQVFQIRNDSRSGGTVGPMLSSITGIRAVDAGLPQLSMHSIRATTGSRDPGLGVRLFEGFFDWFEEVDAEFK